MPNLIRISRYVYCPNNPYNNYYDMVVYSYRYPRALPLTGKNKLYIRSSACFKWALPINSRST